MIYDVQEGVVMQSICGVSLLVSTLEARKVCPYLLKLNNDSAFLWELLVKGRSTEEIVLEICNKYDIPYSEADEKLRHYLDQMEEFRYIKKHVQGKD